MWFPLIIDDKTYIIKSFYDVESYIVYCSDFENIWVENLKGNDILKRFQELNDIEMPVKQLKTKLHSFFYDNRNEANFTIQDEKPDTLNLKILTKISHKDIVMGFNLRKESASFFSQNVVLPLCFSLILMKKREQQLIDIIHDKDIELKEHKLSGHFLENKKLITQKFDETSFKTHSTTSVVDLFSNMKFVENFEKQTLPAPVAGETSNEHSDEDTNTSNDVLLSSKLKRRKQNKRGPRKRYRQY